jgi:small nuclear ribonucleoprotein (snRNP)-like protein
VGLLDSLKGKNVEIKVRELSTINGKLVDYDDLYVFIQVTKTEKGKTTTEIYYIPHFNVIYISPT